MDLQEVITYLKENKYLLKAGDIFVMSRPFMQAVNKHKAGILPVETPNVVVQAVVNHVNNELAKTVNWENLFIEFIKNAQVPARLENNRLEAYAANKFSVDACKVGRV
jgi:hypothetical protein